LVQQGTIRIDIPVSGTDKLNADLRQFGARIDQKYTKDTDFPLKLSNMPSGSTIDST